MISFVDVTLLINQNIMKSTILKLTALALLVAPFGAALPAMAATPQWDTTGSYVVAMNYLGNDYTHDMTLMQAANGTLTGNGGSPVGANVYTWVLTSGTVSGNTISFSANYTATPDAVIPQTTMNVVGTIAANGTMSGTWSDNYQGGARSGSWTTTTGTAVTLGALAAEDFGVVNYDTDLGILKGYTAGFGLTDATFENSQSVIVKLYAGATLLQTNTATAQVGIDITGNQISSPFDVQGTFDYVTDGYWVNVREAEFGQNVVATRVVATVVLENGKTVTAENTNLTGDASILLNTTPPVTTPTMKDQCKNGGWKTFTNPSFKNQGQCVASVVSKKK
jgi:hypothetical protein